MARGAWADPKTVADLFPLTPKQLGQTAAAEAEAETATEPFLQALLIRIDHFDQSTQMEVLVPMLVGHTRALDCLAYHSIAAIRVMRDMDALTAVRRLITCATTCPWNPAFYWIRDGGFFFPFGIAASGSTLVSTDPFHCDEVTTVAMHHLCSQMVFRKADPYSHFGSITATPDSMSQNLAAEVFEPFRLPLVFHIVTKLIDLAPGHLQMRMLTIVVAHLDRTLPFYARLHSLLNDVAEWLESKTEGAAKTTLVSLLAEAHAQRK